MVKVISFSLWGNQTKYTIGAIRNAELVRELYPNFECWFYIHKDTVPNDIIEQLQNKSNVKIIFKYGDLNHCKPTMWRFEAIDETEVEILLSRDTDSRIYDREVIAVNEWLSSGKIFHIMRDHPYHSHLIMAGMFGTKKIQQVPNWKELMINVNQDSNRINYDQNFLRDYIYPYIVDNSVIHASFNRWESHAKPFPIPFNNEYNFVGEYVYIDNSREQAHIDVLKTNL